MMTLNKKLYNPLLGMIVGAFILFSGCSFWTEYSRESVCDDVQPGESVLCEIVNKMAQETGTDVTLEDVGAGIVMVNSAALASGKVSNEDVRKVVDKLLKALDGSVTYALFSKKLEDAVGSGLLMVAKPLLDRFSLSKNLMKKKDLEILRNWLTERLEDLS